MRELKGATIWARHTIESDIFFWKPAAWFKIWFYLVQTANHVDGKQIRRGECLTSIAEIAKNTGTSRDQVDKMLRWAKQATMIATRKTTRGMVITLLTYGKYQALENYKSDSKSDSSGDLEATGRRQRGDMIQENGKNGRMKSNTPLPPKGGTPTSGGGVTRKKADPNEPQGLDDFIASTKANPDRAINLIGEWADTVKPELHTRAQWQVFLRRHLRAARELSCFTDHQISVAFGKMVKLQSKTDFQPTLETLKKFIV